MKQVWDVFALRMSFRSIMKTGKYLGRGCQVTISFTVLGPKVIMLVEVNSLGLFFSKMEKYEHILPHAEY